MRSAEDSRIHPLRHEQKRGTAVARNTALRAARGEFTTYLDHDDEYNPDHLAHVVQFGGESDVLVFGYDLISDDGQAQGHESAWDPSVAQNSFFVFNAVTPLGVAHRRWRIRRADSTLRDKTAKLGIKNHPRQSIDFCHLRSFGHLFPG
ncbi:MAG: glycosyltransferase family 2 protein [Thermoguttaceae bacterium]